MRYLGLDLGTKTLGIAISDKTNTLVTPLPVFNFGFEEYDKALERVIELVNEYEISEVVLGFPKNMDGSIGFAGERSLNFQKMLENNGILVTLEDERLTTKSAIDLVHLNNGNVKNTKKKIDSIAASIILESYLKRKKWF